jgi:hypothetical protein
VAVFEVDTGGKLTLGEPNRLAPLSDESAEGAHNPSPEDNSLEFQFFIIHFKKVCQDPVPGSFQLVN